LQPSSQDPGPRRKRRRHFARPLSPVQSVFEWVCMALLLAASLGSMWYFGGTKVWSMAPPLLAFALGLVLFFLRPFLFDEVDRLPVPPGGWAAVGVLGAVLVWLPFAPVPHDAALFAVKLASAVAAYWVWTDLASHHGRWRWLIGLLIFTVTLMGWYALILHGHESNAVLYRARPEQYGMRASGAFVCPNHFAHLIGMVLTVGLALLLGRESGAVLRLLAGYAWLVLLPVLYLTESRSGWLGLAAGVLTVVAVTGWRAGAARALLGVLAALLVIALSGWLLWTYSPVVHARVAAALQGDVRQVLWRDTWAMIEARPWLGFGPGSYRWVFPHYQAHFRSHIDPEYAHNEYLHAAAEVGVVGLLLLLAPFGLAVLGMLPRIRRATHGREATLIAAGLGALAATGLHAAFDFNLQVFSNLHALALLAGIMLCGWSANQPGRAVVPARPPWLRTTAVAGMLGALGLGVVTLGLWMGWHWTERAEAERERLQHDAAEAHYLRACRWSPWYAEPRVGLGDLARSRTFWLRAAEPKQAAAAEALRWYGEAGRLNPWDPAAPFGRSRLQRHLGRPEEALAGLAEIVQRNPYHAYYLAQWGVALFDAGRDAEALEAFRRSRDAQDTAMARTYIQLLQDRLRAPAPAS
jgi:O-antigen ligase